ncbi:MAG: DUF1572 family protein [Candidatus Heimdallarchaeota archaeon]
MSTKAKDEMDLKELAISTLEIAEINFLMSFIEINPENIIEPIHPEINPIVWIIGHCISHMDWYLSLFTGERILTENQSVYFAYGASKDKIKEKFPFSFREILDKYVQISGYFFKCLKNLPEEKFHQEISKENGEESLFQKIQRITLHYMGHTGQITIIRRALGDKSWGFVSGIKRDDREKYMKKWIKWWEENKMKFNLTNN